MSHRREYRLLARAEQDLRDAMWTPEPENEDEFAYGYNPPATPALIAEANRQWAAIPSDPVALSAWMRGGPVNPREGA